ncbi:MAG: single-stranded DNA-binding protein [Elusimicrobia bacterium]|nr:single-stranded DNA-binding protein [Elusimicrobiota bacterium]
MKEKKRTAEPEASERRTLPMLNEVRAAGRLVDAAALKDYGEGKVRAQFTIAVPRPNGKKGPDGRTEADFFLVSAWDELARQCATLGKGDPVEVEGRIRTWRDESEGYRWAVTAAAVRLIPRGGAKTPAAGTAELPIAA